MQLVFCLLAMIMGGASACQKFNEGSWAKEHKPDWNVESMSPSCKQELDAFPYLFQQRTFAGYFVTVPGGAPANYQVELDLIIMFKWHCLRTCLDDFGEQQISEPLRIEQGIPFTDNASPDLVTLRCVCGTAMETPTKTMRELDAEWMATCHFNAPTTTVATTTTTTTTTTTAPKVFKKAVKIGCFGHSVPEPRLSNMAMFSPNGYDTIHGNGPDQCATRCLAYNPDHVFAGLAQSKQCWCGTQADAPSVLWWGVILATSAGPACETWIDKYPVGGAVPCSDTTGDPAFKDYANQDHSPRAPWGWCGGNNIMMVYRIETTP